MATTTYLTGDGGNDTLPSNNQGYGRVNLGRAFDGTVNQRVDQDPNLVFTSSGQLYTLNGSVATVSKPFRVVLAWTDHPGTLGGNAWVNDLNLEVFVEDVEGDYLLYHGNHFSGSESVCFEVIGVPPPRPECANPVLDGRNNVEAVFLPAGFLPGGTSYQIRVRAMIIADDAVPGIGVEGDPDQDFALFVYNGTP